MKRNYRLILLLSALLVTSSKVNALQEKTLDSNKRSVINISATDFTRISILDDRIENIFGKKNQYYVESDDKQGQIFIEVTDKTLKEISITLLTENGVTQDLLMKVADIPAETVIFKQPKPGINDAAKQKTKNKKTSALRDLESKDVAKILLKAMVDGKELSHYKMIIENQNISIDTDYTSSEIILTKIRSLLPTRNQHTSKVNLIGEVHQLTNHSKNTFSLNEQDFYYAEDIKLITIANRKLAPGKSTFIYFVREVSNVAL